MSKYNIQFRYTCKIVCILHSKPKLGSESITIYKIQNMANCLISQFNDDNRQKKNKAFRIIDIDDIHCDKLNLLLLSKEAQNFKNVTTILFYEYCEMKQLS